MNPTNPDTETYSPARSRKAPSPTTSKKGNATYNFINQVETESSRTITQTNQHTISAGYEIKFKAAILGFAGVKTKISVKYDFPYIDPKSNTESDAKSEKRTLPLGGFQQYCCTGEDDSLLGQRSVGDLR
ncbi:hypothetical protein K505DRAFT_382015 [Melanomma pulvis-pyrius CBS 109.77]|uniref:Uncharacterized protein n=1 Tax=Melanomma pulvis-pyrius CBS 109.77 TaxID=1314802 RepID=A0A6A6XJ98_9PLEO|nr:hypothetical protein K505DRAFT_382015 [Melanomma pulvis-pyrius CBS 109.77]